MVNNLLLTTLHYSRSEGSLHQERGIEVGAVGGLIAERQNSVSSEKEGTKELRSRSKSCKHKVLEERLGSTAKKKETIR